MTVKALALGQSPCDHGRAQDVRHAIQVSATGSLYKIETKKEHVVPVETCTSARRWMLPDRLARTGSMILRTGVAVQNGWRQE